MILLFAFALAVALGLLRGGQLSQLKSLPLQSYWLALVALLIQVILVYTNLLLALDRTVHAVVLALTYGLLALFVWRNRQLPGMWLVGIGLLANTLVIFANGGYMPITYDALVAAGHGRLVSSTASGTLVLSSKDVLLTIAETRFWLLSDIFVIPPPFPIPSVFSLGDAVIALGMFQLISHALGVPVRVPVKSPSA